MAKRVTQAGKIDRRFSSKSAGLAAQTREVGGAQAAQTNLGEMPFTLFLLVAGVVIWLYIRRAHLGIDTHPGEGRNIPLPSRGAPPVLPPIFLPQPVPPLLKAPEEAPRGRLF